MDDSKLLECMNKAEKYVALLREGIWALRESVDDGASPRVLKAFAGTLDLEVWAILCEIQDARIALRKRIEKGE